MKYIVKITLVWMAFQLANPSRSLAQTGEQTLAALGTLGAVSMYNTFVSIGSIVDAESAGVYDREHAIALLEEQSALMDNTNAQLQILLDSRELTGLNDVDFIEQMRVVFSGLQEQASLARAYYSSLDQADADAYQQLRDLNWTLMSALMGIGE